MYIFICRWILLHSLFASLSVEVWKEGQDLPEGVSVGDNKLDDDGNTIPDYQGIDHSKLVPLLTAALKEAIGKIEALETKFAALEAAE